MTKEDWEHMKPKFNCPFGVTNVWTTAQLRNSERIKKGLKAVHLNQKPFELIGRIIEMSSDKNDVVWDHMLRSQLCWLHIRKAYT